MSAESVILQGRAFAESLMTAACTIRRNTGRALDEHGEYVPTTETIYAGPCELKFLSAVVREVDAQGQAGVEQEPLLKLPVAGSEGVRVDDVVEITSHSLDPAMVGVRARIAGVHGGSVTARRFPVEVTSWGTANG